MVVSFCSLTSDDGVVEEHEDDEGAVEDGERDQQLVERVRHLLVGRDLIQIPLKCSFDINDFLCDLCFSHSLLIYQFNSFSQCKILASEKIEDFLDLLCEYLLNFSVFPPGQREKISQKTHKSNFFHQLQNFGLRKN